MHPIPSRQSLSHPKSRIIVLKTIIVFGLIFGVLLSPKLWYGPRLFPVIPIINGTSPIPTSLGVGIFIVMIGSLAMIVLASKPRNYIFVTLMAAAILAFFDQMRWQPWLYQYVAMLAVLAFFSWDFSDTKRLNATLNMCRLIVASMYFYSGLQKLNYNFLHETFPWIIAPFANSFPAPFAEYFSYLGVLIPFLEMGIGVGLCSKTYRNYAIGLSLAMMIFILIALGPFGRNWNSVIWPWNVVMFLFVLVLFWRVRDCSF